MIQFLSALLAACSFLALPPQLQTQSPQNSATSQNTPSKFACSWNSTLPVDRRTPEACAESDYALYGHPVFFPARKGVALGVSSTPGKPLNIHIWVDNQTDQDQSYSLCCNVTFASHLEVYDANSLRVPSKWDLERERLGQADTAIGAGCGCAALLKIPMHTLMAMDFGDLSMAYTLPPGRYTISESIPPSPNFVSSNPQSAPSRTIQHQQGPTLTINLL